MTTGYRFGHSEITGQPPADWSHAASYLAQLNKSNLETQDSVEDVEAEDRKFRETLLAAGGVDGLSPEDRRLAEDLASADGVDISYFPGGSNYRVSLVSDSNPLGLPGDLWAFVSDASEGALVSAIVRSDSEGELEVMGPDGLGWTPLTDPSALSDLSPVGVTPEAIVLFRNYDRDNTLGVISSYPLATTGPFPTQEQLEVPMSKEIPEPRSEDDEYWENTGETPANRDAIVAAITVNGPDDLEDAIAAAAHDPDLRWYVERRVQALGLEASLPWLKD